MTHVARRAAAETCQLCPPDDNDCVETGVVKACDAIGDCVADTGDLCEEAEFAPRVLGKRVERRAPFASRATKTALRPEN